MNPKRFLSFVLAAACLTTAPPHFGASAQQPAGPPTPQTGGQSVAALRERAWAVLDDAAHDKEGARRAKAIRAAGVLRPEGPALDFVTAALTDKDPDVRAAAATSLGEMRAVSATPQLESALSDSEYTVVMAAAAALVVLKNDEGFEVDYELLTHERKTGEPMTQQARDTMRDRNRMITLVIEQGLQFAPFGGYGVAAWQALHTMNNTAPVRAQAALSLARDPDPKSATALLKAMADKQWMVRAAALKALGLRGDARIVAKLAPSLDDSVDAVRFAGAATIYRLASAVPPPPQQQPPPKLPTHGGA
ncbi:MAG TPA: HEAT repeat domain-containing protein [Methylomirabilota bacterium]|nr:HEAT repeat domain-containing protein [Methylomirabilota bacterium]